MFFHSKGTVSYPLFHIKKAFTLMELLVVIGVMAILICLLLPALAKGKEIALRISCTGNMKQLSIANLSYIEHSTYWAPRRLLPEKEEEFFWYTLLGNELGWEAAKGEHVGIPRPPGQAKGSKNSIFLCPKQKKHLTRDSFFYQVPSYLVTANRLETPYVWDWQQGTRVTSITSPSEKVAILEYYPYGIPGQGHYGEERSVYDSATEEFYYGRHLLTCNLAFFDGHVKAYSSGIVLEHYKKRRSDKTGMFYKLLL